MNKTTNVKEGLEAIHAYAENPLGETRVVESIEIGEHVRQGDLYITPILSISRGAKAAQINQLAEGTTMGSRHTVGDGVKVYRTDAFGHAQRTTKGANVAGYQVQSDTRFTVEHPEHADISLPPGCYQVSHQVDPTTLKRVQD